MDMKDLAHPSLQLEESWAYKVTVVANLIARRVSQTVNQIADLNLSQWRVLAAIGDQEGRTASQVVDMTPMDKGIVSRAVASLIAQGYLRRESSEQDGRVSHLFMTESGRKTYNRIVQALNQTGATGDTLLSQDAHDQFLEQLNQIIQTYPK